MNNVRNSIELRAKRTLKKVPGADLARDLVAMRHTDILRHLALFAPNSAGRPTQLTSMALASAQRTFPAIVTYLGEYGSEASPTISSGDFSLGQSVDSSALAELFEKYQSDKSTDHDYHLIYAQILDDLGVVGTMLEVGLGTNNERVVSNMSRSGRPGASLRAFRDYLPSARVYGADIDREVLFSEERIETYFVDQTDLTAVANLASDLPALDLVIDDGLHSPDANMNVLWLARQKLRPDGWVVIEDIAASAIPFWKTVGFIVAADFESQIILARNGVMWAGKKK